LRWDPCATGDACTAEAEAAENAQARMQSFFSFLCHPQGFLKCNIIALFVFSIGDARTAEAEAAENMQACACMRSMLQSLCPLLGILFSAMHMRKPPCDLYNRALCSSQECQPKLHVLTQAAKTAADVTESAAAEAGEAANENNALESTSKAAVAAWRASQARPRLLVFASAKLVRYFSVEVHYVMSL
jgi:hypothetical protein